MSPEGFLQLAGLLPEPAALLDGAGTIIAANRAFAHRIGKAAPELAGQRLQDLVVEAPQRVQDYLRMCRRNRSLMAGTLTLSGPDGPEVFRAEAGLVQPGEGVDARLFLRLQSKSSSTDRFVALNQRIVQLNLEVRRRQQAEAALRQTAELLQFTLDATGLGHWDYDLATGTMAQTPRVDEIFGYSGEPPAWTGTLLFEKHLHPEDREPVRKRLLQSLAKGSPELEIECRIRRADGEERWIWARGSIYRTEHGTPRRITGLVMDVTERKGLERALREADRRKDEFIATLAHELRNPLAPLRNGLQLLQLGAGRPDLLEQARIMMDRQVSIMVRLIDDLLDLSRITTGKLALRAEPIDLSEVLTTAVETSRPLIEQQGHRLELQVPQEPVPLLADPARLSQVFSNLLNNSAKFTAPGGTIGLRVERKEGKVLVRVHDNGEGIPPEMLQKVFEMFAQVDRSLERTQSGVGIGLMLVRRLVEMHGGRVRAYSEGLGKGSEFVVELPVAQEARVAQPSASAPPRVLEPRRVLVADDNEDAASSLSLMLQLMGHEVCTAADGLDAVEQAGRFRPEVALLDIGMPRMNGYDAARRIRKESWGAGITLIALTGWGQEADKRRSREAGFDHHLTKPLDPDRLHQLLAGGRPASP